MVVRTFGGLAAAALAAAALGACGGDSSGAPPEGLAVEGVGEQRGGSTVALAQCADWLRGTRAERLQTIEDIRGQLTPQTATSEDTGYPDEEAYALFQRVCDQPYAAGFRLYKVYGQAAAFQPLREGPPGE